MRRIDFTKLKNEGIELSEKSETILKCIIKNNEKTNK